MVDASGAVLGAALAARPDLVTPNLAEAEGVLHGHADESVEASPDARPRAEAAAAELVRAGAGAAIVTAAAAGAAVAAGAETGVDRRAAGGRGAQPDRRRRRPRRRARRGAGRRRRHRHRGPSQRGGGGRERRGATSRRPRSRTHGRAARRHQPEPLTALASSAGSGGGSRLRPRGRSAGQECLTDERSRMIGKRAVHGVLHPGVRVLARLSYPRKLTLLAVLLAIPAAYASWAYMGEQNAKIAFSDKERVGVRYVQPAAELLGKLVAARHDAVQAAAAGRPVPPPDVQREVSAVAAVDRELGAELLTTAPWRELQQNLDDLSSSPPADTQALLDAYGDATAGAQALIVQAGDKSNLILDPDLDSYYVMDAIITKLPAISDTIGRAGDLLVTRDGSVGVDQRIELAIDKGIVESAAAATMTGLGTAFESTHDTQLEGRARGAAEASRRPDPDRDRERRGRGARPRREASTSATAAAAAADMNVKLPAQLDRLLATRVDGFHAASRRVQLVLALGLLIALYAFSALYLLVTRSLREMADAAEGLAEGDVNQHVTVNSRDEVGRVAAAFKDMIEYLGQASDAAKRIAGADLTIDVQPRSERDALGTSLASMTTNLREILGEVSATAGDLSASSQQMASTADEAGRAVGDIATAVSDVASGAERQVRSMESARTLVEGVVSATAQSAPPRPRRPPSRPRRATRGPGGRRRRRRSASDAMTAVREASEHATAAIRALGAKSSGSTASSPPSRASRRRPTCSRSTPRSRPPAPASKAVASPSWRRRSASSPRSPRQRPARSPS